MTTLKQSVRVAYRSSAVAHAAAETKERVARVQKVRAEDRMKVLGPGRQRVMTNKRLALWHNYYTAQGVATYFFASEKGVKFRLERLWVQMGHNVADLPNWDDFAHRDLKTVIAFRNLNGLQLSEIRAVERAFAGNSHEIPTGDFEEQFEEMLDLFVNDIWAAEGMRRWTKNELNRTPEPQADLDDWDDISNTAGKFFRDAKRCCVRLANNFRQYQTDTPDEALYLDRYTHRAGNRYNAVQGLWALDAGDLAPAYLQKVENKRVTYR